MNRFTMFAAAAGVLVGAGSAGAQTNLAGGATIIDFSSSYVGPDFNISNVIDGQSVDNTQAGNTAVDVFSAGQGDTPSYWLTLNGQGAGAFFTLDLGAVSTIQQFRVANTRNATHGDRGTLNYDILASNAVDPTTNDLISPVTLVNDQAIAQPGDPNNIPFQAVDPTSGTSFGDYRYIQFLSNAAVNNNGGLNEFQVIGVVPEPSSATVLLGGVALAVLRRRRRA